MGRYHGEEDALLCPQCCIVRYIIQQEVSRSVGSCVTSYSFVFGPAWATRADLSRPCCAATSPLSEGVASFAEDGW
jgi:hypothetical protein